MKSSPPARLKTSTPSFTPVVDTVSKSVSKSTTKSESVPIVWRIPRGDPPASMVMVESKVAPTTYMVVTLQKLCSVNLSVSQAHFRGSIFENVSKKHVSREKRNIRHIYETISKNEIEMVGPSSWEIDGVPVVRVEHPPEMVHMTSKNVTMVVTTTPFTFALTPPNVAPIRPLNVVLSEVRSGTIVVRMGNVTKTLTIIPPPVPSPNEKL